MITTVESRFSGRRWQFTKDEIDHHSPSRNDGIDLKNESYLRKQYCTFLQEIGMRLKVPQLTIASAMLLCHQFFMRQSHAKNDWQTIASACIFLACKVEETPRFLNDVVVVTYEMINKWDPAASKRIRQKEVWEKQKELILAAENFLLTILAFDLNFQLPYKPLVTALKKLNILSDLAKVAWNFVNDWMRSTLCLQYKPHYIAAGSLFLAAKLQKVKLPTEKGRVWWQEFEISPKQLEEVIQDMRTLLDQDKKPNPPSTDRNIGKLPSQASSQSCISSVTVSSGGDKTPNANGPRNPSEDDTPKDILLSHSSNSGCESVVEDGDDNSGEKPRDSFKIDVDRIREVIKKRKREAAVKKTEKFVSAEVDSDGWIEHELESGIEISDKKLRIIS